MRAFLSTPFYMVAQIFAFITRLISGRPVTVDWPLTIEEALNEGYIDEATATRLYREMEEENE